MFDDFAYAVQQFMDESGFTASLTQPTGSYNAATGSMTTVDTVTPVRAILMDRTLQHNGLGEKGSTEILAGDKQMFVQPPQTPTGPTILNIDPTKDTVLVGSVRYKIVTLKEINPTSSYPMLYELYVRR
jgi:hypothetical protein